MELQKCGGFVDNLECFEICEDPLLMLFKERKKKSALSKYLSVEIN